MTQVRRQETSCCAWASPPGPLRGIEVICEDRRCTSGELMVRVPGTGLYHVQDTASVGFKANIFLLPKDVSFNRIDMRRARSWHRHWILCVPEWGDPPGRQLGPCWGLQSRHGLCCSRGRYDRSGTQGTAIFGRRLPLADSA